jgi:hypothetical protein
MKLAKKQLEKLSDIITRRDDSLKAVGALELRKAQLLNSAYSVELEYEEFKNGMTEKYGDDVQIDMQTGDIVNPSNDLKKV